VVFVFKYTGLNIRGVGEKKGTSAQKKWDHKRF